MALEAPKPMLRSLSEGAPAYDALWIVYARDPEAPPPKRWRSLVSYGRLDIVARVLLAALYPGGALDGDTALILYLEGDNRAGIYEFTPECLPETAHYEEEAARILLAALHGSSSCSSVVGGDAPSLEGLARLYRKAGYAVKVLREGGKLLQQHTPRSAYIVGTYVDPPPLRGFDHFSVGPCSYLASHVVAYVNALRRLAQTAS
ncbi:MAG: hypothetical protein ABWW70_00145 [Thermoproteota archaeon]